MIQSILKLLQDNPSLILFAALAAGYALGRVRFGTFSLGSTTGVLLVSIVLGAVVLEGVEYDLGLIKTVSFGFFIFAIGYRVGPDFVGGVRRGGVKYIMTAFCFCAAALLAAVFLAKAFGLNQGYAGGLVGGALTQSSVIGTADGAIAHLAGEQPSSVLDLKSDVAVAYAVTYIFGTAGLIVLLKLLWKTWRIDLPGAAKKAEAELGSRNSHESLEAFHWSSLVMPRAYRVESAKAAGRTVSETEEDFGERAVISRLRRNGELVDEISPGTVLQRGDIVVLTGYRTGLVDACDAIGPEVDDGVLKELVGEILGICVTSREMDGRLVSGIMMDHGHGCFLMGITRQGHELPLVPGLKIHRGDTITVIGTRPDVERLAEAAGYPERPTQVTDLIAVGTGLIAGTLLGLVAIQVAGVPVTLGIGGGVLVSGILFGWLRSLRPTWGQIPGPAQWVFTDVGLNLFIACVGISAGPSALHALQQAGVKILLAGVCLTTIPHVLTWLFGLYVMRLNPVLLLGVMTGAGTCTAALNTVKVDAGSAVPVIGYTVPYAIGNVLLTVWGALIVHLV